MTHSDRRDLIDASTLISKLAMAGQPVSYTYIDGATDEQRAFVEAEIQNGQTALELLFSAQDHIEDRVHGIVGRNGVPTAEAAALMVRARSTNSLMIAPVRNTCKWD